MKTHLAVAWLLCASLLAGCRTTWNHPDNVGEAQFRRDAYECERDAAYLPRTPQAVTRGYYGALHYSDPTLGWGDVARQQGMFNRCMESKGYVRD